MDCLLQLPRVKIVEQICLKRYLEGVQDPSLLEGLVQLSAQFVLSQHVVFGGHCRLEEKRLRVTGQVEGLVRTETGLSFGKAPKAWRGWRFHANKPEA